MLFTFLFFFRDVSVISSEWLLETNSNYFKSKLKRSNEMIPTTTTTTTTK